MEGNTRTSGYVSDLSPRKRTINGNVKFDFNLQKSPTEEDEVMGFGEDNYRKVEQYKMSRSLVKMDIFYHNQYQKLVLNERCSLASANIKEVTFQYNALASSPGSSISTGASAKMEVVKLKKLEPDNISYTVIGKILYGDEPPKQLSFGTVKEDAMICDITGMMPIRIWGPLIKIITNEGCYQITHLKIRKIEGEVVLTTSPRSSCTVVSVSVDIPTPQNVTFANLRTIIVEKLSEVGDLNRYVVCIYCKKKMPNCIGKTNVKCEHCKRRMRVKDLEECLMVPVFIYDDESETKIQVTATGQIILSIMADISDDDVIADFLLDLKNISITYKVASKMITEMKCNAADDYDLLEVNENILNPEGTLEVNENVMSHEGTMEVNANLMTPKGTQSS